MVIYLSYFRCLLNQFVTENFWELQGNKNKLNKFIWQHFVSSLWPMLYIFNVSIFEIHIDVSLFMKAVKYSNLCERSNYWMLAHGQQN